MLQQMRRVARSKPAGIVLALIAASFALWGIGDVIRGGSADTSVASVGGEKIPYEIYSRDYKNATRNASQRLGELTPDQIRKLGLADKTLQDLINRTAMDGYASDLGLVVGDDQVTSDIRNSPSFVGPLGTFDRDKLLQVLNTYGFTEPGFIAYVRQGDMREQVLSAARDGFEIPPGFGRALFDFLNERRAVDYIVIPESAAADIPAPTDAQLKAFIAAHAGTFSVPAYRTITYAEIGPADIAPQVVVTDKQIQQEYDNRKQNPQYAYDIPEKRVVEQLNFKDAASAKAARQKIDGGMSFADVAKSLNQQPIDLGEVTSEALGDRGPAVFALADNGVTQPLKNLAGYALMHVSKIEPGSQKKLDDVKADIRKDLADKIAADRIDGIANDYIDASGSGLSLPDAAKKVGMHVIHVAAVDANGLAPDGTKAQVPDDPIFRDQMFKAEVGEDQDPFQGKDGKEYVLNVDSETPSRAKPFEQVRDQAVQLWTADARQKALAAKAQSLAAEATKDNSLDGIAKQFGVTPKKSGALERGKATGDLPAALVAKIFAAPPGSAVGGASSRSDAYIVARVTGVRHPPAPVTDPEYQQFISQVSAGTSQDIATILAMAVRDKKGVTINQKMVDQATGDSGEGS
ncbi:MAG TPA: SurA N-terminal domain-containing protein [Rhizomicrobium sp.]|nr:SurA N-terminal domain-containing protein [Rhizomicrobium sp.]